MVIKCLSNVTGVVKLAGVQWYSGRKGSSDSAVPSLIIAFDNGRCQLMTHELDDSELCGNGCGLLGVLMGVNVV